MPSLIHELSFLTGVPIHYYAAVDIDGMRRILDIVGGVDIVNQQQIDDATYGFSPTHIGFHLSPGPHHLDASEAMAYMRSRHGGGSDFLRAARQQEVLLALRKELISPASVFKLPALLDAAGQAVKTNFPQDRLGELLNDAKLVNDATIERYVLGPPYSVHPPTTSTNGQYILKLKMDELAALSVKVFGAESTYFQSATAKPRN
jgi:anionic cell wall polymer biosynthesis LytR-Cps2A-Psr (LCP) family protein